MDIPGHRSLYDCEVCGGPRYTGAPSLMEMVIRWDRYNLPHYIAVCSEACKVFLLLTVGRAK